jgi:hypothetical protein
MGLRFRRRIRIAPGIRLNLSKSGAGLSLGGPGGSLSFGPQGPHIHAGIPGTGIHYREKISLGGRGAPLGGDGAPPGGHGAPLGGRGAPGASGGASPSGGFQVVLDEEARLQILDADGRPLPPNPLQRVRAAHREELRAWLARQCERWNEGIDEILELHLETPPPHPPPVFEPEPFDEPEPAPFRRRDPGILGRLWRGRRERIEEENRRGLQAREAERAAWEAARAEHERREAERRDRFERGRLEIVEVMEDLIGRHLAGLEWPRETEVCFEIRDRGERVLLDVDLPPANEMPTHEARPAARQYRVLVEERSERRRRLEYARHVHGVLFRVTGETFHHLPRARTVVASGFTQWPDPATGGTHDDYLVSARIARERWEAIRFGSLEALDPERAFERFELRREMTKAGIFEPVEPFGG